MLKILCVSFLLATLTGCWGELVYPTLNLTTDVAKSAAEPDYGTNNPDGNTGGPWDEDNTKKP